MTKWKVLFSTLLILMTATLCYASETNMATVSNDGSFGTIQIDVNSIASKSFNGDDIVQFSIIDADDVYNAKNFHYEIIWVNKVKNVCMIRYDVIQMNGNVLKNRHEPTEYGIWEYIESNYYAKEGYQYIVDNGLLP